MRLLRWLILSTQTLICFILLVWSCTGSGEDSSKYLYESAEENHFVREFTGDSHSHPDFIYSPNYANARLVVYYADWCPHCRHFKPKYIELSNKIHEMSQKFLTTVETFAVSCVPQAKICSDQKIRGYPTVMIYPAHSINGTHVKYNALNPEDIFQKAGIAITQTVDKKTDNDLQLHPSKKSLKHNNLQPKPYFMHRSSSEAFRDAHISFHFAMKTAIFTQTGPLPKNPKVALKEFLSAMKMTLPSTSSMHPVVDDLLANFESVVKSSEAMDEILDKHHPPEPVGEWSKASLQHGTGYTAGLWMLFHIMSVGLVQWNQISASNDKKLVPSAMADTQRNYVEHFFQCEECRLHFLSEFDACLYDRCNRLVTTAKGATLKEFIQYPLWLYETHNAVNVRLRKERVEQNIEKEDFTTQMDVMWPSYKSCPSCWMSNEKDRWDEIEIYKFLQQSYWPGDSGSEVLRILSHDVVGDRFEMLLDQESINDDDHQVDLFSIGSYFCLALMAMIVWYRKKRYNQRGMHKRN